jgi:hypothetical protein
MSRWKFWERERKPSAKEVQIDKLVEESTERLEQAKELSARVERVSKRLNDKYRRNGWGEVIAETMRRAEH